MEGRDSRWSVDKEENMKERFKVHDEGAEGRRQMRCEERLDRFKFLLKRASPAVEAAKANSTSPSARRTIVLYPPFSLTSINSTDDDISRCMSCQFGGGGGGGGLSEWSSTQPRWCRELKEEEDRQKTPLDLAGPSLSRCDAWEQLATVCVVRVRPPRTADPRV
ncbi:hypothetical protein Pcinc_033271 [Petrolisthes cinctipes]|uniref:Uncharacterized protein n=1 Tax=Petrolisthes cinctipes TaxID=88211 RepID=A0AAE1K234_PETCI|nr:hypothetical protein Pcinc_033271 [Petrolisthes cinctipes]